MATSNLLLYELVLLICGAVFFLALIIILIYFVIQKRKIAGLLPFFAIPFLMMGFPAFQSIKLSNNSIEIEKKTSEVDSDPGDSTKRAELNVAVGQITWERAQQDPETCLKLAEAKFALGEYDTATTYVNYVLKSSPGNEKALALKNKIDTEKSKVDAYANYVKNLEAELEKLKQDKNIDSTQVKMLVQKADSAQNNAPRYVTAKQAVVVAEAYAAARRTDEAKKIILNVKTKDAVALKLKIDSNTIKDTYRMKTAFKVPESPTATSAKRKRMIIK